MRFLFLTVLGLTCSNLFGQFHYLNLRLIGSYMDLRSPTNKLSSYKPTVFGVSFSTSARMSEWIMMEAGLSWNSVRLIHDTIDKPIIKLQVPGSVITIQGLKELSRRKLLLYGIGGYLGSVANYYTDSNIALLPDRAINFRIYSMFISIGYVYRINESIAITLDSKLHYGIKRIVPDSTSPLIYSIAFGLGFRQ